MDIKTKIIATIGPATLEFDVFQSAVEAGIDYIRINTAYGDYSQYDLILNNLEKARKVKNIGIIFDIKSHAPLDYAKNNKINLVAVSFTEKKEDIAQIKNIIEEAFVISKIESVLGVKNFDEILTLSDGIMIARGDLGMAVSLEKVPPLQKEFTGKTIKKGKFLVTATEMLLSMVNNPKPTRAEVSDVANAVFEHSSAVMLSEETAIGKYPVESIVYMKKIIFEAENWLDKND